MSKQRIRELEQKLEDLKQRWPAHSVPPHMLDELENLEQELEKAKAEECKDGCPKP